MFELHNIMDISASRDSSTDFAWHPGSNDTSRLCFYLKQVPLNNFYCLGQVKCCFITVFLTCTSEGMFKALLEGKEHITSFVCLESWNV